jgi:hypothetical protein
MNWIGLKREEENYSEKLIAWSRIELKLGD